MIVANKVVIDDEVRGVLEDCEFDTEMLVLPDYEISRELYVRVNKVIEFLGGKWSRKFKCHLFVNVGKDEIRGLVGEVLEDGEVLNKKQEFGIFYTPGWLADFMVRECSVWPRGARVLEPSAGNGAIAERVREFIRSDLGDYLVCCEVRGECEGDLSRVADRVVIGDFLEQKLVWLGGFFDVVVMNPPFARGQDVEHVVYAHGVLGARGSLVSVMSRGWLFKNDKRSKDFREWFKSRGGVVVDIPDGVWKEAGTGVKTCLVVIGGRLSREQLEIGLMDAWGRKYGCDGW